MLPYVKSVKTAALSALLAVSLALPATPALAWGDREQGVLTGIIGTLAVGGLIREANKDRTPAPRYYYVEPRPQHYYGNGNGHRSSRVQESVYNTPAAQAFNSYSRSERLAIQRRLSAQGYYYGGIDGSFGPGTYRAVEAYARDSGNRDRLSSRNGAFALYDSLIF